MTPTGGGPSLELQDGAEVRSFASCMVNRASILRRSSKKLVSVIVVEHRRQRHFIYKIEPRGH